MPVNEGGQQIPANLQALINQILEDREARKRQEEKINKLAKDLGTVKQLVCDEEGRCRLVEKKDLEALDKKGTAKPNIGQFSNKELYNQLIKSKVAVGDLEEVHLEKLKEDPKYLKKAADDPKFAEKLVDLLCTDESCRITFNSAIDKARKDGKTKGEKKFFLSK